MLTSSLPVHGGEVCGFIAYSRCRFQLSPQARSQAHYPYRRADRGYRLPNSNCPRGQFSKDACRRPFQGHGESPPRGLS